MVLAYQTARAVLPELAILDPVVGGLSLLLVAHQVDGIGKSGDPKNENHEASGQMVGNDINCIVFSIFSCVNNPSFFMQIVRKISNV